MARRNPIGGNTILIAGGASLATAGLVYLLMRKKETPQAKTLPSSSAETVSWSPIATCDILKSSQADLDARRPGSRVAIVPKSIAQTVLETLMQLDPRGAYSMQCD